MTRSERQKIAIQNWIKAGCRGTLQWATGTGKTRAAILGIKSFLTTNSNKKIVVIVPTEYLKLQWLKELVKFDVFNYVQVEIINSAIKINSSIDLVVLDEVHRMAADTFYEVFVQRTPKLVLGLSATFSRLDGKHAMLAFYCPIVDTLSIKEALDNKWLSPYQEYKVIIEPEDFHEYQMANAEFLNAFSYFNNDFNLAMRCVAGVKRGNVVIKAAYAVRYEYATELCTLDSYHPQYYPTIKQINGEITAMAFTWSRSLQARKNYVLNHPKKIEITRKILNARMGKKVITFSATIKQAEKIGNGFVVHSGKTKKKNRITMDEFALLPVGVVHTAKSLDEGADIPGLNLAIILCNTSSQTQKTQRIGRVIRYEEDKEAEIFTLVIKGTNEEAWYSTSTAGKSYIEITESELDDVLAGKESTNIVREGKEIDQLFRF
jgi:superfamily II DNA or RNA helicase